MRKVFIVAAFIICTSFISSCSLIQKENVVEQASVYEESQYEYDSEDNELSKSEIEELKWLIQTIYASHYGESNTVGKGGVLDTEEKQAEFLMTLNEIEYDYLIKDSLEEYVIFEDDKKLINRENAELILKMAGASTTTKLWQYLSQDYKNYMESEEVFDLPMYARTGSETFIEYRDWTFIMGEDGKLTVRCKTYIPAFRGYIREIELRLHKNEKSVFGGYSADYMIAVPIEPEGITSALEEFNPEADWGEYKKPLNMGNSIDEYIFKLDGSLYQMPFPLEELISNGWKCAEKLKKDEKREEITLTKEGKKIYCIVWNSQKRDDSKWYVVSLKTGFGEGILDVDFELFANRKRGDYAYGYREHGVYGFGDPLYLGSGIGVYAGDDKNIQGFDMVYAPKYTDRIKRLKEIATDVKSEINITETGNFHLERDISYKLSLYDEPVYVQVKSLDKIGWAADDDIIWVKKKGQEEIIGYIEYGSEFTLCIDENKQAKIEVVRMEDSPDDEPEVLLIQEGKR